MDLRICGIIDIVIFLGAIVFIIIGFKKGFMRKILSFAGFLLVIALSFIYCGQIANILCGWGFLHEPLRDQVVENLEAKIEEKGLSAESETYELIEKCLNVPEFIARPIANTIKIGDTQGTSIYRYGESNSDEWVSTTTKTIQSKNAIPVTGIALTNTDTLTLSVKPSSRVTLYIYGFVDNTSECSVLKIDALDKDNNVLKTLIGTSSVGSENLNYTFAGSEIGTIQSDSKIEKIVISSNSSSVKVGITKATIQVDYFMTLDHISNAIADGVYHATMNVIAWVIIFVAVWIIILVLKLLASLLRRHRGIAIVDGILGSILYLGIYAALLCVVFFLLSLFVENNWIPQLTEFINVDFQLDTDQFRISKVIYEGNILKNIVDLFIPR